MAHRTTAELWRKTMDEMLSVLEEDNPADPKAIPTDVAGLWKRNGRLYVRYVRVFRQLEEVYDQMVHPQKRRSVRTTLDAVAGRILELREVLCQLKTTHYPQLDEFLAEFQVTPDAFEILVPRFAAEQTREACQLRETKIKEVLASMAADSASQQQQPPLTPIARSDSSADSSVLCQALLRLAQQRGHKSRQQQPTSTTATTTTPTMTDRQAAVCIQRTVRGFLVRKKLAERSEHEAIFLGMRAEQSEPDPVAQARAAAAHMKLVQSQHEEEYRRAITHDRAEILERDGPEMRETMRDEVTHFFLASKEQLGRFPAFPTPEQGGSAALFPHHEPSPTAVPTIAQPAGKPGRGGRALQQPGRGKKPKAQEPVPVLPPSYFLTDVHRYAQQYTRMWQTRDESKNPSQKHDSELLHQELQPEIEAEVRAALDATLQIELEALRKQVDKQTRTKKRKKKQPVRGPGGADEGPTVYTIVTTGGDTPKKKPRKKKGKKEADPAAEMPLETMFAELVKGKILVSTPAVSLGDFQTAYEFMTAATTIAAAPVATSSSKAATRNAKTTTTRAAATKAKPAAAEADSAQQLTIPSAWDIKQAVLQLCLLPLTSEAVHAHSPAIQSVLLFGPASSGKRSLARAIASDTGSAFFDVSSVSSSLFLGNARQFVTALFRVACEMQPSVIFASDVEKSLFGRPKKAAKSVVAAPTTAAQPVKRAFIDPAKLRKEIARQLKALKPTDRVLFVATTSAPYNATKVITSFFSRFLFVGHPDYTSRMALWSYFIAKEGGTISAPLSISTLARVSEGYSAGSIKQAITNAIAANQRLCQDKKALPCEEYISHLSKINPTFKAEDQQLREWAAQLPLPELKTEMPDGQSRSKAAAKGGRKK